MLKLQSRYGEESDPEVETLAKEELAKLQRQFRIMEESRKAYTDQAQNSLRKQRTVIEMLEAENKDLKKNLSLAGSRQNELKDDTICEQFTVLFEKKGQFEALIGEEQRSIAELEKRIREKEQGINKGRKDMGGVHMSQQQHISTQKRIRVLENRLDNALKRFNSGLASNAELRSLIDHLRQERQVFDSKYNKLEKELNECKRQMGEVIEMSTQAYDARDDAQTKMVALKEKMDKELKQYNAEIKELIIVIEHDRKLKEFMSKKDQERTEAHEAIEAMRRRREAEKAEERDRTVMSYETGFQCIQEATGITDIDQLVTKFIEVEDQNFALFNYVNELNNEIESLQEAIAEVKREIEAFKNQGVEMEERRKVILRGMEAELTASDDQRSKFETRQAATVRVIEQLKSGVESLFNKTGCDSTTITDMLGGQAGITSTNVLQYMGIIEQRANELLQLSAFVQAKESDDPAAMATFLQGRAPKQTQGSLATVQPPSSKDDYDSDASIEDENKPLTQEELRARLAKRGVS
jgi:chromosome segregation ATPase